MTCPFCSTQIPAQSRFCSSCGRSLSPSQTPTITSGVDSSSAGRPDFQSISHTSRFLPGTLLGNRYRIVGPLGRGGMGEVYRADDLKLNQAVAIKVLPEELQENPDRLRRFVNEVRLARQITHSNVCRVFDVSEVDGLNLITMEYIDGEDLASLLRRIGHLPRDKALQICRQLCAGLATAHEVGIIHRDLKPANIMVDGRGRVRITDFGLAALEGDLTGAEARAGTLAYMAPEQLANGQVTIRSDLYSLGLVMYEIFTGKPAFEAQTVAELSRLQLESTPPSPSSVLDEIEPAIERIILRCLEKNPNDRPASALAVAASLPGGDPLAEALAAGETPSPEMVAEAGARTGLKTWVAVGCLLVFFVTLVANLILSERLFLMNQIQIEIPPSDLTVRARNILDSLGYGEGEATDWAYGLQNENTQLIYLREQNVSRQEYVSASPAPITFWYRQSPDRLIPANYVGFVTRTDPPVQKPGMMNLKLDTRGHLQELTVVPPETEKSERSDEAVDWRPLLEQAGLDPGSLEHAEPAWNPPIFCDQRAAWTGVFPDSQDLNLRVEAGAYNGRPAFLRLIFPWTSTQPRTQDPGERIYLIAGISLFLIILFSAVLMARRNIRLGRGDRRGAFVVAAYCASVLFLSWVILANHVPGPSELNLLMWALEQSVLFAAVVWLLYMALEPYARRLWPDTMISWNRLLGGRFRDPLIGRDILIGAASGNLIVLLAFTGQSLGEYFGWTPEQPLLGLSPPLVGIHKVFSQLLYSQANAIVNPFVLMLFILVLKALLRKEKLVFPIVFLVFFGLGFPQQTTSWAIWLVIGIPIWILVLNVLIRFGVLAAYLLFFFSNIYYWVPMTSDFSKWYADQTLLTLAITIGLVLYGLQISLGGRSLVEWKSLEGLR